MTDRGDTVGATTDVLFVTLVAIFLAVGAAKVLRVPPLVADFARFGYPAWSCPAVGGLEIVGAALLVAGLAMGKGILVGGCVLLAAVMVGAVLTHVRVRDRIDKIAPALTLLLLLIGAGALTQ